jgi:hypothetical protein
MFMSTDGYRDKGRKQFVVPPTYQAKAYLSRLSLAEEA